MPLTFDQLREGMRVHCTINFERITDARVCLAGGERFYLCQNTFAGSSAPNRYGYKHSHSVHRSDTHLYHITHAIARHVCQYCGEREDSVSWRSNAEQTLCDECYSELFTICDRCCSDVAHEDTSTVDGDETWCDDCVSHHALYCKDCCGYFTSTNTCDDGSERCDECSTQCDECGEYYANKEITEGRCPDCGLKAASINVH